MSIYDLTGQYKLLENAVMLNPEDMSLQEELEKVDDEIEIKAENYAKLIRNVEADIRAIRDEEIRLASRRVAKENFIKSLKSNLMWSMKETGKEKIKSELFSISVAKNGGKVPITIDVKPEELPKEFQKVIVEADKDALRDYIQETGDLSYAHFEDRGEHLSIR